MIRINLLPQARKQVRAPGASGGTIWGVVYLGATLIYVAVLSVIYVVYDGQLDEQKSENHELTQRIAELRERSSRLEEVETALAESRELETMVAELNRARTGPTRVLMELSRILTAHPRGGPTIDAQVLEQMRRENPFAGYNQSWDVKRLWLTAFEEEERACRIHGRGKTNEDVAEFMQRLALSELFEGVTLTKTEQVVDDATAIPFIDFELSARVRY